MRLSLLKELLPPAVLFAVNYYLCAELFHREYIDQLGSIEAVYIGLARYIQENWRDLTWFPLWYGGIPFQNTYAPLLHLLVAAVGTVLRIPPGTAYHATTAFLFCLGPCMLYWLARRMSRSWTGAFVAGLAYTVVSPSAMLISGIARDLGGLFAGRRLQTLVGWGEGPHVSGLTLVPLAWLMLLWCWRRPTVIRVILSAFLCGAVAITNWHAGFTLAIGIVCLVFASDEYRRLAGLTVLVAAAAYGLVAPWLPPSTILTIQTNARTEGVAHAITIGGLVARFAGLGAILLTGRWLFGGVRVSNRWKGDVYIRFVVLFTALTSTLTLASEWVHFDFLPQANRYHLQMEMGLSLLAGILAAKLLDGRPRWVTAVTLTLLAILSVHPVKQVRRVTRDLNIREIDMRQTPMFKIASALESRHRVYLAGAHGFWLNAFSDAPQFDGGFSHGVINPAWRTAWYAINANEPGDRAVLWMKAYGVHAVAVSGPDSVEPFKPISNARKFDGILPPIWHEGDDTLYRVSAPPSLAHSIEPAALIARRPESLEDLRVYVAAIEKSALAFDWTTRHSAKITGILPAGNVISVQISYHPGWSAVVNGQPRAVRADGLGQMIVDPKCTGICRIDLNYDGGAEMRVARRLPWIVLALFGIAALRSRRKPAPGRLAS